LLCGNALGLATTPAGDRSEELAARCMDMASLSLPDYDLEITTASYVRDAEQIRSSELDERAKKSFVPFCKIEGYFERRTGANDTPYAIGFGVSLPENWNGRYLFQGGGALNGLIREPLGGLASGDSPALFRGFAVVSTDSGHQSDAVFNHDFFEDQKALLNFYSQAVHKTTNLTKKIVSRYYGDAQQQLIVDALLQQVR